MKIDKETLRAIFEKRLLETFPDSPIGTMEINGKFSHYMNSVTDTLFIGFIMGYREKEMQ